jgi:nicotinamide-nucleotide amidase
MERRVAKILIRRKLTIAVAESCTGGLVAHSLTNIPGSSAYFICGVVAYANKAKIKLCHVKAETLKKHGAVSQETALELARNIKHIGQTRIGLGITGIAGPGGGSSLKPVGTIYIAVALGARLFFKKYHFEGSRLKIKDQAKNAALKLLLRCLRPS